MPGIIFTPLPVRIGLSGIAILAAMCAGCGADRPVITIAAVGPMTGATAARGKDLSQAAQMAADEINATGGVNGRLIHIEVYDDGDQPSKARELAAQIGGKTSAVAVLGQVASSAAIAAGEIYKANSIPALTGAASESGVTKGNPWYFRLLPDAAGQGRFLADYARYQYGARELAVLRETGTAGEEFAAAARDQGKRDNLRIVADVEFTPADVQNPARLAAITAKLGKLPKGSMIAVGTQYAESPAMLRALRDQLGAYTGLGYSSLANDGLAAQLASAESGHAPGYYSNGFTVAAPQLPDVAGYGQTLFADRFRARYHTDPTPEAVRWYEAAELVIQAMQARNVTGADVKEDRGRIREWLASHDRPAAAAAGVAGPIYFDPDRNVQQGLTIGTFYGGRLVSAPVQFTAVSDPQQVPGWERLQAAGNVIDANGTRIVKTPVVYAGMLLNALDNIDVRNSTFAADFLLWFRYKDDLNFDIHQIEFPTAVSGGDPGKELGHRSHDGFTTITHHVKGVFRADYEFSRFPFDRQVLRIPVQQRNSTSYSLILAYSNDPESARRNAAQELNLKLWRFRNEIFFRDVVDFPESFGELSGAVQPDVEVNRINAAITIERDVAGYALKNFLPLLCILVAVMIGYALAPDVINPRVSIGVTALLTTSVLYQKVASDLPTVTYIMGLDYIFFAFFGLCVLFLTLTVVTYETHRSKHLKVSRVLNQGGGALTLIGLGGTIIFVWIRYWGHA